MVTRLLGGGAMPTGPSQRARDDRRQHVRGAFIRLPALLAIVDVGRLGQTAVDRAQGVHERDELVRDFAEGGLCLIDRPRLRG
jgi:hypothetical protein